MARFAVADYAVFFATIGCSLMIGVFFAIWDRKKNTPLDYFLAGRQFSTLPAALSFIVTFQSSLMILGSPAEVYVYGLRFAYSLVGIIAAYTFAGITAVPVFHSLKVTSVYKYFRIRYGNNVVRYMTMTGGIIYNVFYMGTVTYGTCVALEVVMGIPFWVTVLLYTIITATYTSIGGIKAVIWTDVFQLMIMITGIVAILTKATIDSGGTAKVWEAASDRLNLNNFKFDPRIRYQFWNVSFGSFCIFLYCTYTQAGIQRINTTPTVRSARWLYLISGPLYALFFTLCCYEGAVIFAYHALKGCDIIASKQVTNINEIVPVTVLDLFDNMPGLSGLFIASLSSAALSTLSSCLNSLSAITYEDILKVKYPHMTDKKATFVSKIMVLMYGLVGMGLTFTISQIPGSVSAIFATFMGSMEGPSCAIFILSTMYRRSTTPGIVVGGVTGMAVTVWLALGQQLSNLPAVPTLPDGPTDTCFLTNTSTVPTTPIMYNTTLELSPLESTELARGATLLTPLEEPLGESIELSPLQQFYSTSYIMFSFVGFFTSMVVGVAVSLCTKPPKVMDERCLFSLSKHLLHMPKEEEERANGDVEELKLMPSPYDVEIKALGYRHKKT